MRFGLKRLWMKSKNIRIKESKKNMDSPNVEVTVGVACDGGWLGLNCKERIKKKTYEKLIDFSFAKGKEIFIFSSIFNKNNSKSFKHISLSIDLNPKIERERKR